MSVVKRARVEEAMDPSVPSIAEVRGTLLALQKNLECPICLDVMKEPVSTNCAHIFCRFCTLELLRQKKGVSQCPLCNAKVTKRSLREDVRFKQVIKVVLEIIHAFERDTGLKFSDEQCFPKNAKEIASFAAPQSEQLVIDSKGYRDRLKRVKAGKKGITYLEDEKASLPLCDRTVTRYSLRNKSSSGKTVVLEVGSDSSEDVFKKMGTDRNMGFEKNIQISGGSTKNQSTDPCHVELPEPSTEDGASLKISGTGVLLEDGLQSIEEARDSPEHLEFIKENVAVKKSQDLSFPHPRMGQLGRKSDCSSIEEDGSYSILSMAQLGGEVVEPTTDEKAEGGAEGADAVQPVGSAHILDEHKEQVLPSQTSPDSPFSPITGKRLMRSIQKVSEWLSKSQEVLSSSPPQDVQTVEVDWDLNPTHVSDAVSCVSQKIEPMEEQGEITVRHGDRPLFKPTASKIEDKVFGRTYKRERKSTPFRNERERTHIQTEEGIAANTTPCESLMRKNTTRKRKATSELTPEDFIKRQGMKGSSKRLVKDDNMSSEVCDPAFIPHSDRSVAEQEVAELPSDLPVKERMSILEADVSEEPQSKWPESDLKNLNLKTKNLSGKRGKTLSKAFGPLELIVDGRSKSPEMAQIQVNVKELSEVGTGQKKVRRSRRLQLLTDEVWNGDKELQLQSEGTGRRSEPAQRERKQMDGRVKTRRWSQAEIMLSPSATGSTVLQGPLQRNISHCDTNLRGMEGKAGETWAEPEISPCVIGTMKETSMEQTPESLSPCCIVHRADSQGSCSLLHFQPTVMKKTTPEDKEWKANQPENGAWCAQAEESNVSSTGDMTGSCKPPETADKFAGTLEPNPETDDSELDTGFMKKIFSCCKRQSFLLHTSPVKEHAAEIQGKLSIGRVEDDKVHCIKKPTQNKERKEAVSCEENRGISVQKLASSASDFPEPKNRTEHLQLASQTPFSDLLSMPLESAAKNVKGGNHPQSQKPATDKIASLEIGREPASPNGGGSNRSPKGWRNGSFQGASLSYVNETDSNIEHLQDAGSVDAESQGLALRSQPELIQPHLAVCQSQCSQFSCSLLEKQRSSVEKKQLNSNLEEATDSSSVGIPKCFVPKMEQDSEKESQSFGLSVETPDGLLDPINEKEGSSKLWEIDRSDILAVSAKTGKQSPLGRDLKNSDQSSSKLKTKGPIVGRRRQVRKLPSSEEEDSSEDEELPSLQALLFGTASRSLKEKETAAEMPALRSTSRSNLSQKDEEVCLSQESEGSVNLFSSQSPTSGDSDSKPCDSKWLTASPSSRGAQASLSGNKDTIKSSSKAYKDTEPLKDPRHEGVNIQSHLDEETLVYDSEASHLGDSSGLSSQSEILTTQQRDAMQNNLKKLHQEMADIEAALRQGSQNDAPEEWPLPDEEDDFTGGQSRLRKGNKVKLTPESKQSFLADVSITVKSTHCIPDSNSTLSSKSKEPISNVLTPKAARGSPGATPGTGRRSSHERQGGLVSPFTAATYHSARKRNAKSPLLTSKRNMSLVASGLNQGELRVVQRFARKTESVWSNKITEETTHVVMKTDEDLVCERTLKYFLGIAGQKWVVSYQWIEQSLKAGKVLNEEDFEVRGDVSNGRSHQAPKRARGSSAGKLFQGLEICCYGPFTDMLPEQLEWMVELCGATLVRQPHLFSCATHAAAVVVVQPDAWVEDATCPEFPLHCSATVVSREWVLDSVACYQRRPFEDYVVQQV
ncbi:breast cancer type 1 susceptibility protein [Pogona vitticeps]